MLSRLLINPYTLGALALVFVGMAGAIGWYAWDAAEWETRATAARADAARLKGERDTVIALSAQKDQEIARLSRQAEINNNIMADLHQSMLALDASITKRQEDLDKAAQDDPTLSEWLNSPLPDGYKRLYNRQ